MWNIFDHCAGDIGNKIITGTCQKILVSVSLIQFRSAHMTAICIVYWSIKKA